MPDDAPKSFATTDSIVNAAARLGLGADTLAAGSSYAYSVVSRNRQNLDNAYRGSWLVGVAVDSVADDMTRAGIEFTGDMDPGDIENIQQTLASTATWQGLADTVRWARLYGGAVGVILIDGQDPETELRPERVRKDQYKGLLVLDRWMVTPSLDDVVTEFGPEMGQPRFYRLNAGQNTGTPRQEASTITARAGTMSSYASAGATISAMGNTPSVSIHHSRCIRMDGATLPFFARQAEMGWGQSVVERMYDRLLAYDSATQGAAQLVYKAHLRTLQVKGLREAIAFGGKALDGLVAQVDLIRKFQSNDGLTLLDAEDVFQTYAYGFAGLPELLQQFSEQLSGALQIPVVRLFGQSPAGFSNGEADLQNYYDTIATQQEARLRRPLTPLLEVVARSTTGKPLPDGVAFKFVPLWQMTSSEKADVATKVTTAVTSAASAGLVSPRVGMQELKQSSFATGIFTNISDEDIEAAESEPPDPNEMLGGPGDPGDPGGAQEPPPEPPPPAITGATSVAAATADKDFEEARHPRDAGKFSHTRGRGAAAKPGPQQRPSKAPEPAASGAKAQAAATPAKGGLLATVTTGGTRTLADGSPLPPHAVSAKIPPGWTDVRVNPDPDGALVAQGRDAKGRAQAIYSAGHGAQQAAAKFARVKAVAERFEAIQAANVKLQASSNPKVKDAADCLDLVMKSGIRPGSEKNTGADKQAFGATTLQGQHVVTEGGSTALRFVGKKGVSLNLTITDKGLATMLRERAAEAGPKGKLFPGVTPASLNEHAAKVSGGIATAKDFRTHLGTASAAALVRITPAPTDPKSYRKAVMDVAKRVSAKLGNTPTMALQAYIDPSVFAPWAGANAGAETGSKKAGEDFSAHAYAVPHHDPAVTAEKVLSEFPPEVAAKIAEASAKAAAAKQTVDIHKADGSYTDERSKLHAQIAAGYLSPERIKAATPAAGKKPTFTLLGGRGGSGKGWFKGQVYDPGSNIVLDSDEIKAMLPEYEGYNAAALHEEASDIFDHVTAMAVERKLNIVHDATMKTKDKAVATVKGFKDAGYRTEVHYMYLPPQQAAKRAVDRFLGPTGRLVPPHIVLANTTNEASFDAVRPLAHAWSFRDNNVRHGEHPRLVAHAQGGDD